MFDQDTLNDLRAQLGRSPRRNGAGEVPATLITAVLDTLAAASTAETITGLIEIPTNKQYVLDISAPYAYTIDSLELDVSLNDCHVTIAIDGTPVTGLNAVYVEEGYGPVQFIATGANSVAAGAQVSLTVSANDAAEDLNFRVNITRG